MLSYNEIQPAPTSRRDKVEISRLINSIYYFIEYVFILKKGRGYRLFALHNRRVLIDKTYRTMRGAKIGFGKFYPHEGLKAQWSELYPPDPPWLEQKLQAGKAH